MKYADIPIRLEGEIEMIYIGIDPGQDGAVAMVNDRGHLDLFMPENLSERATVIRNIMAAAGSVPVRCMLETFAPGMKHHSKSLAAQCMDIGIWQGILADSRVPFDLVDGAKWHRFMLPGMPKSPGLTHEQRRSKIVKPYAAQIAKEIWPGVDFLRTPKCKVPHDGMVDAALIAEYCRRTWR